MPVTRREFLAGAAGASAGFALGAFSHNFPLPMPRMGPEWQPGEETFVQSSCLLCPSHCGIQVRKVDGNPVRIDGNPLHPVSEGGVCAKGRAGLQLLYHPGRLTGPIERIGEPGSSDFRPITWEAALDRVAAALEAASGKADSVAWLTGDTPGLMGELIRQFCRSYGTTSLWTEDYRDGSDEVLRLSQGLDVPPAFDLAASDLVLSFGAGLSEAWSCLPLAARARDREVGERARWIQIDVRHSRTAAAADQFVAVRPGTLGVLALGLAYTILKEGLYDIDNVAGRVRGFEDWTEPDGTVVPGFRTLVLRHGRTEEVAEQTGVPAGTIVALAKAFGAAERPVALWDQAVAWRRSGLSDALAIYALNILVGAINRPGGVLAQPPLPAPSIGPTGEEWAARFTAGDWLEQANGAGGELSALFLYYANPVASHADPAAVEAALASIPLVVSFSPFLDESARHADLVLPDHTYLERWQDAPAPWSVAVPVWGVVQPVVEPLYDTRASGDVVLELAKRLGGATAAACPWSSVEELVRRRGNALAGAERGSAYVEAARRQELRELESRGYWLPTGQSNERYWESIRSAGGWFDPFYDYHDRSAVSQLEGGRVWLFPPEARRRIRAGDPGLREGFLPGAPDRGDRAGDERYPLRLVPYRLMTLASGGTPLLPWLLERAGVLTGSAWESWVELHPDTAHELGLHDGQMVAVESEAGAFRARLRVYVGAQPGVVNTPYGLHSQVEGWGESTAVNPLVAVGPRTDPSTGLPDWYSTRVRVAAARS